ncbi:MAG: YncE family protein [Thermomicrobiales bacterium]
MLQPIQILRVLATMVLVAGAVALDQRASRATAGPMAPQDTVIFERLGLQLVDPVTGEVRWHAENRRGVSGAVTTSDGVIFASVAAADGGGTDVYAIPPGAATPESIAHLPGWAIVEGLGADGDRLYLVEFANISAEGMIQAATGVRDVLLPERWRGSAPAATARRNTGGGVLSPDARRWYRMQSTRPDGTDELPKPELLVVTFAEGVPPSEERIPIPDARGYTALLMAPDGSQLYVVDFLSQSVFTVEAEQGSVSKAVEFGQHPIKRPPCAAALSPLGDTLYVLGNSSNTVGDGVLAFDTTSWQPVGHFLPGQGLTCLAVSPDGNRLFASAGSLVIIDARTGEEQRRVALSPIEGAKPNVVLVATTG